MKQCVIRNRKEPFPYASRITHYVPQTRISIRYERLHNPRYSEYSEMIEGGY